MGNIVYLVQDLVGTESKQFRTFKDAMMHVGKLWEKHYYQSPKSAIIYFAFLLTLDNGELKDCMRFATNRNRENLASHHF